MRLDDTAMSLGAVASQSEYQSLIGANQGIYLVKDIIRRMKVDDAMQVWVVTYGTAYYNPGDTLFYAELIDR